MCGVFYVCVCMCYACSVCVWCVASVCMRGEYGGGVEAGSYVLPSIPFSLSVPQSTRHKQIKCFIKIKGTIHSLKYSAILFIDIIL